MFCGVACRISSSGGRSLLWCLLLVAFVLHECNVASADHRPIFGRSSAGGVRKKRSGGYPKFPPVEECGSRVVQWSPEREPRVVGGDVPPKGAVPWQVELRQRGSGVHHCGGALISRRLVVTAAHCFTDGLVAVAGTTRTPLGERANNHMEEQILLVEGGVKHPDFRQFGPYSHDIAVLLIAEPGFKINRYVRPACLTATSPPPGTWCEVSGWGATNPKSPDKLSELLRTAAIPILSMDTCRNEGVYGGEFRRQPILDTMICAGQLKGGVDACGGDSGGPLVCQNGLSGRAQLVGVVSWGDGCAKPDRPGVYTRVSSYHSWIRNVGDELLKKKWS